MRLVIVALTVILIALVAVYVGERMSSDAMGVIVGLVCGIGAGIPVMLVIVWALDIRQRHESQQRTPAQPMPTINNYYLSPPPPQIEAGWYEWPQLSDKVIEGRVRR